MTENALSVEEGPDGFATTFIRGDLTQERIPALKEDVERAHAVLQEGSRKAGHPLRTLTDLTGFSGAYVPEAIMVLAAYQKENAPYIEKSAIFGGSSNTNFAAEIVSAISQRENIALFNTKEEALAWLAESPAE